MFNIKPTAIAAPATAATVVRPTALELRAAGDAFDARGQSNNALICRDMAAKMTKYAGYASAKQQAFAASLVERSGVGSTFVGTSVPAPAPQAPAGIPLPDLFKVMQKHAHFYADDLKLSRKNQDSLVWVLWHNVCVGKIENGTCTLFYGRLRQTLDSDGSKLKALLLEFEANPLAAAMKYGKLAGRCCSCGRDLTDPESIEAGIGPVCATKFS